MLSILQKYKEVAVSTFLLLLALLAEHAFGASSAISLPVYVLAYAVVGGPVWAKAWQSMRNGTIFSEFLLMGIATIGAFAIGEYTEGVAVMLFYMVGEYVQHGAVHRARSSIKSLIDEQPDVALVERGGGTESVHPSTVQVGEVIRVKPGEKVPLDGVLLDDAAAFNTAALTGESKPMRRSSGDEVWAGSINEDRPVRLKVTSAYEDSRLAEILELVQEASQRKAPTQRFITKFAKVYTPIVVWLAAAVTFLPYLIVENYIFQEWFYRALVFLVVSCPCGLVISVPLGYFGGIGAASRNGILLKGSDYLDQLRKMKMLFVDKTGTLTEGTFEVQDITTINGTDTSDLVRWTASLERETTHPIGKAIVRYAEHAGHILTDAADQQEIPGRGMTGTVEGRSVIAGNRSLLEEQGITVSPNGSREQAEATKVLVAVDGTHAATIYIADSIKEDSFEAIRRLKEQGLEQIVMLSGDNDAVTGAIADRLGIDEAYGGLLPDEKYKRVEQALNDQSAVGFAGDGVNDSPVITLADVGIAMGGIGSDAAIETADVVIQTDQPSKIATAIDISNFTHRVVWQNIGIALGIKAAVMALAAIGYASMWAAIFADVGVALIAIGNAVRVQQRYAETGYLEAMTESDDSINKLQNGQNSAECCGCC